jgi:hypothetical protein
MINMSRMILDLLLTLKNEDKPFRSLSLAASFDGLILVLGISVLNYCLGKSWHSIVDKGYMKKDSWRDENWIELLGWRLSSSLGIPGEREEGHDGMKFD